MCPVRSSDWIHFPEGAGGSAKNSFKESRIGAPGEEASELNVLKSPLLEEGRAMSIRVVCPNGHPLNIPDSFAGKTGLCPVCKARVKVPQPVQNQVLEDAILGILGPNEGVGREEPVSSQASPQPAAAKSYEGPLPPRKSCARCNREIAASIHVCPYCHTYIGGLAEW